MSKKYALAGVNIAEGDAASKLAGKYSATTFTARKSKLGKPVKLPGGYAGILDFGKYYLVMGDDGTGTKMEIAEKMKKFDTIGADLLAMVADDAICLGAEVVSITNTLDTNKVHKKTIGKLLQGLAKICAKEQIIIAGGEIAELGKTVNSMVWNATALGIVDKKKIITGNKIKSGDIIIALKENGLRSNGFSLARKILADNFGKDYCNKLFGTKKWGELLLTPSRVYHSAILELIGRFGQKSKVEVRGICHVTGGGIPGNLPRILPKGLGANLTNLWKPNAWVKELIRFGKVSDTEAREVWNLGNGMLIIVSPKDIDKTLEILRKNKVPARIAGEVTKNGKIEIS
jgi:phosphoribosylformylglycinamidine cyclo-ligase